MYYFEPQKNFLAGQKKRLSFNLQHFSRSADGKKRAIKKVTWIHRKMIEKGNVDPKKTHRIYTRP
jgi:hypothetical protein